MENNNYIFIPKLIENTKNITQNDLYDEVVKESNIYIEEIYNSDYLKNKKFDTELAYWSTNSYPNVILKHKIINITNFYTLLFIIDDILENDDKSGLIALQFINILENKENQTIVQENIKVIGNKFKEIINLFKKEMTDDQISRFITYTKEWIEGANYLSKNGDKINIEKYIEYRIKSIGAKSTFFSVEYGLDINLDNTLLASLENIHKVASENMIYVNDLYSYRKELYENGDNPNIINIIMEEEKCDLQNSIFILEKMIKNNFNDFHLLYDNLLNINIDNIQLKQYLDGIYDVMIGNLKWSCMTTRYHGPGFNQSLINGAKIILDKEKTIIIK